MLSASIEPANIPHKYGGQHQFDFGMQPDLDQEIQNIVSWASDEDGKIFQEMPQGPLRWVEREGGKRTAIAVGTENGKKRNTTILELR